MSDFVDFNLAKKLKEKGYPQKYFGKYSMAGACYFKDGRFYKEGCIAIVEDCFTAPMIHQVLKWLREEKGIDILVHRGHISINNKREVTRHYCANVYFIDRFACTIDNDERDFSTYEEATLAGIEYTLDHLI